MYEESLYFKNCLRFSLALLMFSISHLGVATSYEYMVHFKFNYFYFNIKVCSSRGPGTVGLLTAIFGKQEVPPITMAMTALSFILA